jgi:hypothetical protein
MGRLKTLNDFEHYNSSNKKRVNLEKNYCSISADSPNKGKISLCKKICKPIQDKKTFFNEVNSDYNRLKLNGEQWKEELIERERLSGITDSILFDEEEVDWESLYE